MIEIKIENAAAIQSALNNFENKIAKKIIRQGVRAAWKPLLDKAKQNARTLIGGRMGSLIAKNLQLRAFRRQRKGQYGVYVRIKSGVNEFIYISKTGKRAYIPAAIEYGHASPGGSGAKDVPARPFLRNALDVTLPNAPKIFQEHLEQAIREENAKR